MENDITVYNLGIVQKTAELGRRSSKANATIVVRVVVRKQTVG